MNKRSIVAVLLGLLSPGMTWAESPVWIGPYWSHEPVGIVMIDPGKAAIRLRIGDAGLDAKPGLNAPDGAINKTSWQAGEARLTMTWARNGADGLVGRVNADKPIRVEFSGDVPWRDFRTTYSLTDSGMAAESCGAGHVDTTPPMLLPEKWEYRHSTTDETLPNTEEPGFKAGCHQIASVPGWTSVIYGDSREELRQKMGGNGGFYRTFVTIPEAQKKGYGWYRTSVTIPQAWKGRVIEFHLYAAVNCEDWCYLNGQSIKDPNPLERNGNWVYRVYRVWPGTEAYRRIQWGGGNLLTNQLRKKTADGGVLPPDFPEDEKPYFAASTYGGPRRWSLAADQKPAEKRQQPDGLRASLTYEVSPQKPLRFVAGYGPLAELAAVDNLLAHAEASYLKRRVYASGALGDFVSIIPEWDWSLVLYGEKPGMRAMSMARNWCVPGDSVMALWDTLFGTVSMSVGDPEMAHSTIRAYFSEQLPNGLIPNSIRALEIQGSSVGRDRSLIPNCAMCVWKGYQRWPDKAFLAEVYPKLAKWHAWWFAPRPATACRTATGNTAACSATEANWGTCKRQNGNRSTTVPSGTTWPLIPRRGR